MNILQKYTFLCFTLFALNAQSIYAEDSSNRDFQEYNESRHQEHEEREDRPHVSRDVDLTRKLTEEQEAELNEAMNSDSNISIPSALNSIRNKTISHAFAEANKELRRFISLQEINADEIEVNKVINPDQEGLSKVKEDISARRKAVDDNARPFDPLDSAKTIALGVAVPVADSVEYNGRKHFTDLSDDEIENKMVAERLFGLSIAGYLALCHPGSAAVMISGQLLYSIYTLQQRINFREKYTQDPVKTIDAHNKLQQFRVQHPTLEFIKNHAISTAIYETPAKIVGAPTTTGEIIDACSAFYTDLNKKPENN